MSKIKIMESIKLLDWASKTNVYFEPQKNYNE